MTSVSIIMTRERRMNVGRLIDDECEHHYDEGEEDECWEVDR